MVNAPCQIVEHDINRCTVLDAVKTVLREQPNQRDLVLDDERHRATLLQGTIADGRRYERHITIGGRTYCRLRQLPSGIFELSLDLSDSGVSSVDFRIHREF